MSLDISSVRRLHHARGVVMLLVLLVLLVMVLPDEGRIANATAWRSAASQAQFKAWAKTSTAVGLRMSPAEFEAHLWQWAQGYVAVKAPCSRALNPLVTQFGLGQWWRMFSSPRRSPARVWLEASRAGEAMRPWYVSRSDRYDWHRRQFDHNRFRKLIGRMAGSDSRGQQLYVRFLQWSAREIQREQPEVSRVRLRLYRSTTPEPGVDARDSLGGVFEAERVLELRSGPRVDAATAADARRGGPR
jgi:hypothetical protein